MANQPKKYKKFVATAATATLVASAIVPVASAAEFKDVAGSDHAVAINALSEAGIINGYSDGTFKPNQTINRGQVVKMLGRWLEAQGQEIPADWKTEQRFSDLALTAEEELVQYAALAKDAGVFNGSNGKLNYTQNMQRQQMAVVIVRAIEEIAGVDLVAEYKEAGHVTEISDLDKAFSAEQRNAIVALEYAEITNVSNFRPADSVTRGQFASFLHRTIENVINAEVDAAVKAINNTTVEVTFDEEVTDIKALDFAIEGLEISNAAVKQSNKKVVVLTTSAQTADVEYTVTLNDEKIGSFKGLAAVIPTAIDVVQKSQQDVVGNQVTVQAKVTVAEGQSKAGIPVTFNIINNYNDNSTGTLNAPIIAEATTNEEGIATYSYTRYAQTSQQIASSDEVQAYATGKASVRSFAKVYWASIKPLTISEVTTGNSVNNGAKKQYKIKAALYHTEGYTAAFTENGQVYPAGNYVNIAFKENIDVTPDKAVKTVDVIDGNGRNLGYPGQFTTSLGDQSQGIKVVKVAVDKNGEAIVTLTGNNAEVTPVVFVDNKENPQNATGNRGRFNTTELFAEAPKLAFGKIQNLQLALDSIGTEFAAAYATAGSATSYTYENATSNSILIRDAANNLTWITRGTTLPTGASYINQANPLRTGETVPTGFVLVRGTVGNPTGDFPAFSGTKSVHTYYNIANGKSASAQLADALVNTGGRDYKAVLKDEKGNLAPTGTQVRVSVDVGSGLRAAGSAVYLVDKNANSIHLLTNDASKSEKYVVNLATDSKGEVAFTLIGAKDAYATPTVFSETGDKAGLDKNDLQQVGGIAYFGDAVVQSAILTVDGKDAQNVSVGDLAAFTYQTVDQNKKPYNTYNQSNLRVVFQFQSTFAGAEVYAASSVGADGKLLPGATPIPGGYINMGSSNTGLLTVDADINGRATLYVKATRGTTVTATASAANVPSLPQNLTASAVFNLNNVEGIQPGVPYTGRVIATDTVNNRLLLLLNDGVTVKDVPYESNSQFFNQAGTIISESTFEGHNNAVQGSNLVDTEVTFTLAKDSNPTTVRMGVAAGQSHIGFKSGAAIYLTNLNATYNFHGKTIGSSTPGSELPVKVVVNNDNVTLKDLVLHGSIDVGGGGTNANYQGQINVQKFTADNLTLNGNAYVHTNAQQTFNLVGSDFSNANVHLFKNERINFAGAQSRIGELVAYVSGVVVSNNQILNSDNTVKYAAGVAPIITRVTIATASVIQPVSQISGYTVPTAVVENAQVKAATVTTTSGDTVAITFTAGTNNINLATVNGTTGTVTSTDTVTFTLSPALTAGKVVTLVVDGREYTATYAPTTTSSLTFARKY
ncbi:S-layer homology domain-containing protein [Lysinibacillus contaminans]|uniref:S-layer homology domain-containing protein n=1 Tax=Lysinibacillus contaminans TaxID=1293441 RepID=UPI0006AE5988|nr:S-layer homology domain-containing protein [Lysinibacillus contaminans]